VLGGRGLSGVASVRGGRRVPRPVRRAGVRASQGLRGPRPPGAVRVRARLRGQRAGRTVVRAGGPRVPRRRRLRGALAVHRPRPVPESVRRPGRPVSGWQDVPGRRPPGRVRVRDRLLARRDNVPPGCRLPGARGVRPFPLRRPLRERHVPGERAVRDARPSGRVHALSGRFKVGGMSER